MISSYLISSYSSGTPALTSRGFVEEDFAKVADFFDAAVKLAVKIKAETKGSQTDCISILKFISGNVYLRVEVGCTSLNISCFGKYPM